MTTAIQVCEAALRKNHQMETLPADALTAPTGKAALLCASFYDQARKEVLRLAAWGGLTVRRRLAGASWEPAKAYALDDLVASGQSAYRCVLAGTSGNSLPDFSTTAPTDDATVEWAHEYLALSALPTENLTGRANTFLVPSDIVKQVGVSDALGERVDFLYEGGVLYSDAPEVVLVYVLDSTDVSSWDPLLTEAITVQLASKLAYPLTGSHENESGFSQAAMAIARAATAETRREKRAGPAQADPWLSGLYQSRKI
jgi:hypothetical protein